jgi:hypothetical protein
MKSGQFLEYESAVSTSKAPDNLTCQVVGLMARAALRYAEAGHSAPTPEVAPGLRLRTSQDLAHERPARKVLSNVHRFRVARCHLQTGQAVSVHKLS